MVRVLRCHMLNRSTIVGDEHLQRFSVDTQLESKFATSDIEHTLLMVSILCVMILTRCLAAYRQVDLYNNYHPEYFAFGGAEPYQMNESKQTGIYI